MDVPFLVRKGNDMVEREDGVNENGLDYRAGWCEALKAVANAINISAIRASKKEIPGLEAALNISREMFKAMVEKMKSGTKGE